MTTGSTAKSESLYQRACALMPAGVNSPVRAFKKVGGTPLYMTKGEGAVLTDEDGNRYVDFCLAWGPLILGHAHPAVVEAVTKAAKDGLAFGTTHRHEVGLAELVLSAFGPFDRARFVVSGTEAVLTAVRLARAHTGRRRILKFEGCYHGHVDTLLVKAGSGIVTQGLADSLGVTKTAASDTIVAPLGDVAALEKAFAEYGDDIAAAIIEPVPANNGLLLQEPRFLEALRSITQKHGALLIFDEVITGFRFGFHGAARLLGVQPDLCTLGKIVGGGLPVGGVVGPKAILDTLAPLGGVYQAGTMAGNPVALAAGIATLKVLKTGEAYKHIEALSARLEAKVTAGGTQAGLRLFRQGAITWPYYDLDSPQPRAASELSESAAKRFHGAYASFLKAGLYLPPSAYEVCFLSAAHTEAHVDALAQALLAAPR